MPQINTEISNKIATLLKNTGKLTETNLVEAKKNLKIMVNLH